MKALPYTYLVTDVISSLKLSALVKSLLITVLQPQNNNIREII